MLHSEKTKIVYCKDANRRRDFPNELFDFLGFQFRARRALGRGRRAFACFLPAASPTALTFMGRTIRRWTLHHSSDKALPNLAEMYNPCIQGWINYYGNFYRMQLRSTCRGSISMSFAGHAANSSGCVARPRGRATGLIGFAEKIRRYLLIGSSAMEAAEHREPCESRGSCTDLGAPGGETPPGNRHERPISDVRAMSACPSTPDISLSRSKRRSGPTAAVSKRSKYSPIRSPRRRGAGWMLVSIHQLPWRFSG